MLPHTSSTFFDLFKEDFFEVFLCKTSSHVAPPYPGDNDLDRFESLLHEYASTHTSSRFSGQVVFEIFHNYQQMFNNSKEPSL